VGSEAHGRALLRGGLAIPSQRSGVRGTLEEAIRVQQEAKRILRRFGTGNTPDGETGTCSAYLGEWVKTP